MCLTAAKIAAGVNLCITTICSPWQRQGTARILVLSSGRRWIYISGREEGGSKIMEGEKTSTPAVATRPTKKNADLKDIVLF
jgi:hypothetical protein